MVIHCASDIHRQHLSLNQLLVKGDLLLLTGDYDCHDEDTTFSFLKWVMKTSKNYTYGVVMTAGNHDPYIEENIDEVREFLSGSKVQILINESTTINGVEIYGSPNVETLGRTQNREYGAYCRNFKELEVIYKEIPSGLDILLTHTPPRGTLDRYIGSQALMNKINVVKPKMNIFGHIHECHGHVENNGTVFVNCAVIGTPTEGPFNPVVINYDEENRCVISVVYSKMDVL